MPSTRQSRGGIEYDASARRGRQGDSLANGHRTKDTFAIETDRCVSEPAGIFQTQQSEASLQSARISAMLAAYFLFYSLVLTAILKLECKNAQKVCSDWECTGGISENDFLQYLDSHNSNDNYDRNMLFQLNYSYTMSEKLYERNDVVDITIHAHFGSKILDSVQFSTADRSSARGSRVVVFQLPPIATEFGSKLMFSLATSIEDRSLGCEFEYVTVSYLPQPGRHIFRRRNPLPELTNIPVSTTSPRRAEVFNDHLTYSHGDVTLRVSEVLRFVNSEYCSALGSSDGVLLNKLVVMVPGDPSSRGGEPSVRVLCAIFTMEANHATKVRAVTDTWGRKCTEFLAFSTVDDDSIPAIHVHHLGVESYHNMWQKSRAIWKYIHRHYRSEFDYFLLGGDDMYFVMENLYHYLNSEEVRAARARGEGMYLGRILTTVLTNVTFNSGGAGYLLDSVALDSLIFNIEEDHCKPSTEIPAEDVLVAACLRDSLPAILPYNTVDGMDRQRFHPLTPGFHYVFEPSTAQPRLDTDFWYDRYDLHLRRGFDCCSLESISFHFMWPALMYEVDDFLYRCPEIAKQYYYGFYGETAYFRSIKIDDQRLQK